MYALMLFLIHLQHEIMEAWTDSWFKQAYKFAKGSNDARKAFIKKGLLGGGGKVIPEYKKMNGKNVLSRPKTALIFMELFSQTVRSALSLLFWSAVSAPSLLQTNGDDSSDEQRREDLKDMVENLVKFVSYLNKIQDAKPNRLSVDAAFLAKFHACTHEENCAYLHDKDCTVFQMATALHVILTGLGLYMKASKAGAVAAAFVRMCVARVGLAALQHAAQPPGPAWAAG